MAKDPAFLFYYNDWISSTQSMDVFTRGVYIQLLSHQASQGSIPNDIEELAIVAGIRISEFDKFKQVYKRTLEAKFQAKPQEESQAYAYVKSKAPLVNLKLVEVMKKRKEYSEKQQKRGIIGALIKNTIREKELNQKQQKELRNQIYLNKIYDEDIGNIKQAYKRMLIAYIESVNINRIENENRDVNVIENDFEKDKGGVGEKGKTFKNETLDFAIPVETQCIASHNKSGEKEIVIPFTQSFHQTWQQWKSYLQAEFKSGYNSIQSEQASLKTVASLANGIEEKAIAIVEQSMGNRWKTFYELKNKQTGSRVESRENIYPDEFLTKHGLL